MGLAALNTADPFKVTSVARTFKVMRTFEAAEVVGTFEAAEVVGSVDFIVVKHINHLVASTFDFM